jgi:salicylate hydroxylase
MAFNNTSTKSPSSQEKLSTDDDDIIPVLICGAGIVGLTLALALHAHCGITAELFEQAEAFCDDVGAGMSLYANGLKVLRDIDKREKEKDPDTTKSLVQELANAGIRYESRSWTRHDGTVISVAPESALASSDDNDDDNPEENGEKDGQGLQTIGIRRWKLQKVLYEHCLDRTIPIHFGKRCASVEQQPINNNNGNESDHNHSNNNEGGIVTITFEDGTKYRAQLLFAADGSKSRIRSCVTPDIHALQYQGTTCFMGCADVPLHPPRISFPASLTSQCHAVFFPVSETSQCFQFHVPVQPKHADRGNWATLVRPEELQEEIQDLVQRLRKDGWDYEQYIRPVECTTQAVMVGFCLLEPRLTKWVYGVEDRIVLLGDAAHPPVPYIGQGAMMGLEDAGTIAALMREYCHWDEPLNENGNRANNGAKSKYKLNMTHFRAAMKIYERLRIPRTSDILDCSKFLGMTQQKRANRAEYSRVKEELIRRDVFFYDTLPIMFRGVTYDYKIELEKVLESERRCRLSIVAEEEIKD